MTPPAAPPYLPTHARMWHRPCRCDTGYSSLYCRATVPSHATTAERGDSCRRLANVRRGPSNGRLAADAYA